MVKLHPILSAEQIHRRISEIARDLEKEYQDRELVIVMILKGSIFLVADLMRALKLSLILEAIQCSSYGQRGVTRGELEIRGLERLHLEGKDLLLVDDICDAGHTLSGVVKELQKKHPRSIKTLVLLNKKMARVIPFEPDYSLFEIQNQFVVGYGLDYKEQYRNLPGIFILDI